MQTDPIPTPTPTPDPDPISLDTFAPPHTRRPSRHHFRQESTTSTASTASSYSAATHSKRSSIETITTQPDTYPDLSSEKRRKRRTYYEGGGEERWQRWELSVNVNPVIMGRMQDYFRSSTYTLGAALQS